LIAPYQLSSINCLAAKPRSILSNVKMGTRVFDSNPYELIVITLYVSRESVATPSPSAGSGFGNWDVVANGCL
jgi:hypothetical protein